MSDYEKGIRAAIAICDRFIAAMDAKNRMAHDKISTAKFLKEQMEKKIEEERRR
jgi:hypothetical protein